MTAAESILFRHSQFLDPLAGNSVVSHLETSLRLDAKEEINVSISKEHRKYSQ